MNDKIANQLNSYRSRLACLDKPEHKSIWENKPPVIFTSKVRLAREAIVALAETASIQSAPITGSAADKRREEKELEEECYKVARAIVNFAHDTADETTAAKYDFPLSGWRRMRNETLIQRARLLEEDAKSLATGASSVMASQYGITPAAVAALKKEADEYETYLVAPQQGIAARSALTDSLPVRSREIAAIFDQIADLLPQFATTPAGESFVAAYQASSLILDRGHGPAAPAAAAGPVPPQRPIG